MERGSVEPRTDAGVSTVTTANWNGRRRWVIAAIAPFLLTSLFPSAFGPSRPTEAPSPAGPVFLVEANAVDLAAMRSAGGRLVTDYGNGLLLVYWPEDMARPREGVDPLADRTKIDVYYSGITFDTAVAEPPLPAELRGSYGAYLLQFLGPIRSEWLEELRALGLDFDQYLANYAFVVRGTGASVDLATQRPYVGWAGPYHPGYKVAPSLLDRLGTVAVSVIGFRSVPPQELAARVGSIGGSVEAMWDLPPTVTATVPSERLPELAREAHVLAIEELSTFVPLDRVTGRIHGYHAAWSPSRSGLPSSLTGRSPGPDGVMYNGDDVFEGVGIQDTGFDEGSADDGPLDFFDSPNGDRVIRYFRRSGPILDGQCGLAHGTHVVGIVAGDGYASERDAFEDQGDPSAIWTDKEWRRSEAGVAPEAKVTLDGTQIGAPPFCSGGLAVSAAYWDCQYLNGFVSIPVALGVSPERCGQPWIDGADVATHNAAIEGGSRAYVAVYSSSWGSGPGIYSMMAASADARTSLAPERLFVFAVGNDGPRPGTLFGEALLKNGISVGASQSVRPEWFESDDPDMLAWFSGRGSASQTYGRIKPDLVAVGSTVLSLYARGELGPMDRFASRYEGLPPGADLRWDLDKYCSAPMDYCSTGDGVPDYRYWEGTSFAAPYTAGSAMLVREYLREVIARNDPSSPYFNAPAHLVKAFLISGAARMDPTLYDYPGYEQGWGRIDLERSLFPPPPRTNQFETGEFTTTGTWSPTRIVTDVHSSEVPLKVTLVWSDLSGVALARDLDLVVKSPANDTFHGNQYRGGWTDPALAGFDRINNVEQVEVMRPEAGPWSVQVRGVSVPSNVTFSLIFSADVGPLAPFDVDVSISNPAVRLAPAGSAVVPIVVRNHGTSADDLRLAADVSASPGLGVNFYPGADVPVGSGEAQVVLAVVTADGSADEGAYEVDLQVVSLRDPGPVPAAGTAMLRVEVRNGPLPPLVAVADGPSDERDPNVLVFEDAGTGHIFVAYRKTETGSADGLTGRGTVWVAHAPLDGNGQPVPPFVHTRVSNTNDDPSDLRLLRLHSGAFTNRVVITWTGDDPAEVNPDATSWARIAYADPPYATWTAGTIQKNEGTTAYPCYHARRGVPLFRASGGGQLLFIWESLEGYCPSSFGHHINVYAKTSSDGGSTWGPLEVVFAGPAGTKFVAPAAVVDQNDVVWVAVAGAYVSGSRSDLAIRLFDDAGWSPSPSAIRVLDTQDNVGWPAVYSTDEGPAGNRVYLAATRDSLRANLQALVAYADGDFTSAAPPRDTNDSASPGVPCGVACFLSVDFAPPLGSGLRGPFGSTLALGTFDRGPVLQIGATSDAGASTVWLMTRETASPYRSTNLHAHNSSDGFGTTALTELSADGFPKGHPSVGSLTLGGVGRLYVGYQATRGVLTDHGVMTDHDYNVFVSAVRDGWWGDPDGLGPLPVAVVGTPNPVDPSSTFRLAAAFDDIARGGQNIVAAEFSLDGSAGPWSAMNPWDAFDSPTEAAFADIDVALLGWGLGDCHMIYVRGQDAAGNWGPPGSFEECTPLLLTPIPPVVSSVLLAGPMFGDIEITWKASPDEGGAAGTALYRVERAIWPGGSFVQIAALPATGAGTYSWTDPGAGDGNPEVYLYRVSSVNVFGGAAADITLGAKYTRPIASVGWSLVSVPIVPSDLVLTAVLQTLDWSMARTFVAADRGDPWKAHLVGGSSDFDTFDPASGMWVFVRTPGTLTVAGLLPSRQAVQLTPGWNLVAFRGLATSPYTVGDLRAEVPVSRVEGYDPGGGYYLRLLSDAEELSFGFGYWVYALRAATWEEP